MIKFFKHHRRSFPPWFLDLPLPKSLAASREKKQKEKWRKLERDFKSYKLSFDKLQEETGVVYVHLNKTDDLNKQITLIDKLNIEHQIDLDKTEFVIQKKADLVYPYFEKLMKNNQVDQASKAITSIVELIINRSQKGVYDEDARIHRNFGFLHGKARIIDVGRLVNDPTQKNPEVYKKNLHKITARFMIWLEDNHPTLAPFLDKELKKVYSET